MGDRFNSFYQEEQHPFVDAMLGVLGTALNKLRRLPLPSRFYAAQDKAFNADSEICLRTARDLLAARRARPNDKKDLLNAMINAKYPKTGEKLSDDNIIRNMVTFLVAGMLLSSPFELLRSFY
jgi:cytochrome P450/NADPH-cytochrome P450 reductase